VKAKTRRRAGTQVAATAKRPPRLRRIGITCYSHFGGSGVVATELGLALARRGYQVHFVAHSLPFRLRTFASNIYFHEILPASYPVFDQAPPGAHDKMVGGENTTWTFSMPTRCRLQPAPISARARARSLGVVTATARHHRGRARPPSSG
jgi:hypothetical protein